MTTGLVILCLFIGSVIGIVIGEVLHHFKIIGKNY